MENASLQEACADALDYDVTLASLFNDLLLYRQFSSFTPAAITIEIDAVSRCDDSGCSFSFDFLQSDGLKTCVGSCCANIERAEHELVLLWIVASIFLALAALCFMQANFFIAHFPRRYFRVDAIRLSLSSKCLPRFLACVGCSTPTLPQVLHRRHFFLLECDLRTFLLSSLWVPRFPRWRCLNHGCHEKRFRFVRSHHHQSMLLAGLHCQHRRVTYQLL